jgi:hypothetical protein
MTLLIYTDNGNIEVPIIERFTYYIAGGQHEFVIHEHNGKRTLSQYRTGYAVSKEAPDSVSGCKALLDHLQQSHGTKKLKQILTEQATINPQPQKEVIMSLEEAVQANTLAVIALTAAIKGTNPAVSAALSEPLKVTGETKTEETKEARKKRLQEEKAAFDLAQAEKAEQLKKASEPTLDYEKDVKPLIVKVSTEKGREVAIAMLQRLGVSKSADLLPAQYAQAMQFANEVLDKGRDPEARSNDDI